MSDRFGILLGAVLAGVLVCLPSLSSACAVCGAGRDEENAFAFLMTTLFMSVMPLVAIGTVVYVLWRRIRKLEEERAAREAQGLPLTQADAEVRSGS